MNDDPLNKLDPDQQEIARCLRGPVVVFAGAGTGKTRTLTHRIAYGVRVGAYSPDRVLALTFTRKAAGELHTRLRNLGAAAVRAQTFHSAALAQLGYFWSQQVGGAAPKLINSKVSVLSQIAESLSLRLSKDTLRDVAAEIEWRKVSMLNLDAYAQRLTETHNPRLPPAGATVEQLLELHKRYDALLSERKQIDFEDVLILTAGMLETEPRAAAQVRQRYRIFSVDEYQDVSPLQHALLKVWLGERQDICVVGDVSQTIYSFAGASSRYLLHFAKEYPNANTFKLECNYRSTAAIVRTANTLMRGRPGALTLHSARQEQAPPVRVEWFASERDEAEAVANAVHADILAGTAAHEIAILYRANAQSAHVETALQQLGVSCRVHGAQRFFDRAEVRQAVMLLRGQAKVEQSQSVTDRRPLVACVSEVLYACGLSRQPPQSGETARARWDALNAIVNLAKEAPPETTLLAFSEDLLARSRTHHEPTVEAVTLSAVHAAKGLEWNLVYLIGMNEGLLPITYAINDARPDATAIDEERRLAYVAFTRARNVLRISGTIGSYRSPRAPSRFIAESGLNVGGG